MDSLAYVGLEVASFFREFDVIENPRQSCTDKRPAEWPKERFAAEADRFELWAVNLGIFVSGHGSLDYRLRDASSIRDTLRRFLLSLLESLKDGKYAQASCPSFRVCRRLGRRGSFPSYDSRLPKAFITSYLD